MKNFDTLASLVSFLSSNEDEHLRGHVITRNKDGKKTRIIKRFSITKSNYEDVYIEAVQLCREHGARFYVNPTPKSYESIAYDVLVETAESIKHGDFKYVRRLYDSVADRNRGIRGKSFWLLDVDFDYDFGPTPGFKAFVEDMKEVFSKESDCSFLIKTKGGVHLLFRPYNVDYDGLAALAAKHGVDYELKKNALTLIYWG